MSGYYDEYKNDYYNPDDNDKKPGENENWKMIQKGFHDVNDTNDDQDTDIGGLKTRMTAAENKITGLEKPTSFLASSYNGSVTSIAAGSAKKAFANDITKSDIEGFISELSGTLDDGYYYPVLILVEDSSNTVPFACSIVGDYGSISIQNGHIPSGMPEPHYNINVYNLSAATATVKIKNASFLFVKG